MLKKFQKKNALSDFRFLNKALKLVHGVNYNSINEITISKTIDLLDQNYTDSISVPDFRYFLGLSLQEIGCIHTSIRKFELKNRMNPVSYFPLSVFISENGLYLLNQKKTFEEYNGVLINEINGKSSEYIIDRLKNHLSADGKNEDYSYEIANRYASFLISFYLNHPKKFEIKTPQGAINIDALTQNNTVVPREKHWETKEELLTGVKTKLLKQDGVFVLEIDKFLKSNRKFWKEVFSNKEIQESSHLVIDLRGNGGGDRKSGVELVKFLSKKSFGYEILIPNDQDISFLDEQGKKNYRLGKFKYNFGSVFKRSKNKWGKSFCYSFKPNKKDIYKGEIIVMTDGLTGSTSTMVITWLDKYSNSIFIGRIPGGGYNGNNGGAFPLVTLPFSKTTLRFPAFRLLLDSSSTNSAGLKPDIYVSKDIMNGSLDFGKDWRAVMGYIKSNQ